jgi:propionate CoA-transferase
LIEVAPGIDIERDILPYMDFKPLIGEVTTMHPSVFS